MSAANMRVPEDILALSEKLQNARDFINPAQVYRVAVDGQVMQFTGAEMIEAAEANRALVEAVQSGDMPAQYRALKRLGLLPAENRDDVTNDIAHKLAAASMHNGANWESWTDSETEEQ